MVSDASFVPLRPQRLCVRLFPVTSPVPHKQRPTDRSRGEIISGDVAADGGEFLKPIHDIPLRRENLFQ